MPSIGSDHLPVVDGSGHAAADPLTAEHAQTGDERGAQRRSAKSAMRRGPVHPDVITGDGALTTAAGGHVTPVKRSPRRPRLSADQR